MKTKLMIVLTASILSIFSMSVFAFGSVFPVSTNVRTTASCPVSPRYTASNFCDQDINGSGYRAVVYCYCRKKGTFLGCDNVRWVYEMMLDRYHSLENGCENNPAGTNVHECMNQWSCYITGKPAFENDPPCVDSKPMCG